MFSARLNAGILLPLFFSPICLVVSAEPKLAEEQVRLVSAAEGDAIVQAAWELRHGLIPKPDCSHFVHAVYAHAGYLYEYAASRDLFAGVDSFRRVRKPQPGDLVVWQGHIGIVIDPREHSFYSSVLSGFAIENYESSYWMKRGNPRFYRFVVNNSHSAPWPVPSSLTRIPSDQILSSLMRFPTPNQQPRFMAGPPPQALSQQSSQIGGETSAQFGAAHMAALRPGLIAANRPERSRRQSSQIGGETSAQLEAGHMATPRPGLTVANPLKGSGQQPAKLEASARAEIAHTVPKDARVSGEIFVTWRATPSRSEVLAAIMRSADDNGERLLRSGQLNSQPLVGVVDGFRIVSLSVQEGTGLADVEVKEIATFQYGKARPYRVTDRRRVILSRQQQGWILLDPQDLLYLNRRLAATALTNQLATMLHAPAEEVRKAVAIRHELLSAKSADASVRGSE
jgi:hypothetical protein